MASRLTSQVPPTQVLKFMCFIKKFELARQGDREVFLPGSMVWSLDLIQIQEIENQIRSELRSFNEKEKQTLSESFLDVFGEMIDETRIQSRAQFANIEFIYNSFLRVIFLSFPNSPLESYYFRETHSSRNVFSLAGLQRQIQQIDPQAKTSFIEFSQIERWFESLDSKIVDQEIRYLFIKFEGNHPSHLAPLFIRRMGGELQVVVFDSMGVPIEKEREMYNTVQVNFAERIATQINPKGTLKHRVKFYTSLRRQNDFCSCAIFTLEDFLIYRSMDFQKFAHNLSQNESVRALQIQECLFDPGELSPDKMDLYVIDPIPAPFNHLRQFQISESQLNSYFSSLISKCESNPIYRGEALAALKTDLQRYQVSFQEKEREQVKSVRMNYLARVKFFKYSRELILNTLSHLSKDASLIGGFRDQPHQSK